MGTEPVQCERNAVDLAIGNELPLVAFFVGGTPKAKGTLISGTRKDGTRFNRTNNKGGQLEWAAAVRSGAQAAMGQNPPLEELPVMAVITFCAPRPKGHFNAKGELRDSKLRLLPTSRPDADKLCRSVGDALTSVCFRDDAQLTTVLLQKRWSSRPGVHITLTVDRSPADVP